MNIEQLKMIFLIIAAIFIGYIVIRLWAYGIFRSYFDAKKINNKKKEEERCQYNRDVHQKRN